MTTLKAQGQLRHCFWGEYYGQLILITDESEELLRAAIPSELLPKPRKRKAKHEFQTCDDKGKRYAVLSTIYPSEELDPVVKWLEQYRIDEKCKDRRGCDGERHPITGCEHSLDVGPPFEVSIPFTHPDQQELPL